MFRKLLKHTMLASNCVIISFFPIQVLWINYYSIAIAKGVGSPLYITNKHTQVQ